MNHEQRQQQSGYSNSGGNNQQQGLTSATQQIGSVGALFQEPPSGNVTPLPKIKRNGSAKTMALKYADPDGWRAMRAEERRARMAAKRAQRKTTQTEPSPAVTEEDAAPLAKPRVRRIKPQPEQTTHVTHEPHALSAEEIAAHQKKEAERAQTKLQREVEAEQAERHRHNARANGIRAAIQRREAHILMLETALAGSISDQQYEIDTKRQELAETIAVHQAAHSFSGGINDTERNPHNLEAEYLRSAVTRHTTRLALLHADEHAGDAHTQHVIRAEQKKLAAARRALAEHCSLSVHSDRLLNELTSKPRTSIASLETSLARRSGEQQHEIKLQRQKLAESRRELAELICDAARQERLVNDLKKKIAAQEAEIVACDKPGLEPQKAEAQAALGRLQRQLSLLLKKTEKSTAEVNRASTPPVEPVQPKLKESKRDRLWREAMEAKATAEEARQKATRAQESGDTLHRHLDRKATQLEATAALKADKFRKEEARENAPAAKKTIVKPKPKPKETAPVSVVPPAPKAKKPAAPLTHAAAQADAPAQAAISSEDAKPASGTPARKRIAYPKKKPAPVRPVTAEELAKMEEKAKKALAPTPPTNQTSALHKPAEPIATSGDIPLTTPPNPQHDLVQQVLAILNGKDEKPEDREPKALGFAAREMARRQEDARLAAEATAATKAAADAQTAKQKAANEEARLEAIRLEVVGRMRAAREAAGAEETARPAALSWEEAEKARLEQRAKDDAAKAAALARLRSSGTLPSKGNRSR